MTPLRFIHSATGGLELLIKDVLGVNIRHFAGGYGIPPLRIPPVGAHSICARTLPLRIGV